VAKCAACHGPDLVKPKGRFGYVLDLPRVAANPEFVVPSQPAESELWVLVQRDEMPPPDAPQGPLTRAEKEIIREWIAAGSPDASSNAGVSTSPAPSVLAPAATETNALWRFLVWLGKFHFVLLHFPIALVMVAGLGEVWSVRQGNSQTSEWVRICLALAAIAAIPTAAFGWLFAAGGNGVGSPQLLAFHRWLGTSAAVWLVLAAGWAERDTRRGGRGGRVRRLLLGTGILLTAVTAHLGGLLAHGVDFFSY
jgi:hypothetical protein